MIYKDREYEDVYVVMKDGVPRTASGDYLSAQALKTAFDGEVVTVPKVERIYALRAVPVEGCVDGEVH